MKEKEIWKDVPGYEGLYKISNIGMVYSLYKNKINNIIVNPSHQIEHESDK